MTASGNCDQEINPGSAESTAESCSSPFGNLTVSTFAPGSTTSRAMSSASSSVNHGAEGRAPVLGEKSQRRNLNIFWPDAISDEDQRTGQG